MFVWHNREEMVLMGERAKIHVELEIFISVLEKYLCFCNVIVMVLGVKV